MNASVVLMPALARVHGVTARCASRISPSSTAASSTARPPAVTTFDLKLISAKIWPPSPPAPAKNATFA